MRTVLAFAAALYVSLFITALFTDADISDLGPVAQTYAQNGINDVGSANLVTAVIVTYRGLDTLGEVTVLFTASTAIILLLSLHAIARRASPASDIVSLTARVLRAPILLFGLYIIAHGHLSPGGGFPGGAVIASAALLVLLGCAGGVAFAHWLPLAESFAGLSFALLGFWGLLRMTQYLNNSVIPLGVPGTLISAGIIPLISTAIGVKVASELSAILAAFRAKGWEE